MNPRERILAVAVVALVIVAGLGVMFYQFFLSPLRTRQSTLVQLQKQGETKTARVNEIAAQRTQLERYRQQSLPANVDVAKKEYGRYLDELLRKSNWKQTSIAPRSVNNRSVPTLPNKTPIYTVLSYAIQGQATMANLVKMMESFYHTGLMHQIKTLSISRPLTLQQGQRRDELDVSLSVEALVVLGAQKRTTLMPIMDRKLAAEDAFSVLRGGPGGLGAALWAAGPFGPGGPGILAKPERDYGAMASKNIFFGPPVAVATARNLTEMETLRFTILTDITIDHGKGGRRQAMIYDQTTNDKSRLKTVGGFNTFPLVRNSQGLTLVNGEVLRIDERALIFRVGVNAAEPEDTAPYYKDRERIYSLRKEEVDTLVRDGLIRTDDAPRVFWVDKGRWDFLIADKMVTVNGRAFAFRWGLVNGYVLRDDGNAVILRVEDKYCAYRYDPNGRLPRAHEGYCTLHVGGNIADALRHPLKEDEAKKMTAQK